MSTSLGLNFLFNLQNGLKHAANISIFFPMSGVDDFLEEMRLREIVTAFLNIHPTDYSSDFANEAMETATACLFMIFLNL